MYAGGQCRLISIHHPISSKFFKPIFISICAFAFALAGCGGSDKKDEEPAEPDSGIVVTDAGVIENTDAGLIEGDAGISENDSGMIEETDAGIVENDGGMTDAGIHENDASVINECEAEHFGENCDLCTCQHGVCNDGSGGDGKCLECEGNYWGENCDNNTITCVNGTPNIGINGNGKCSECMSHYAGDICDECAEGWDGENCHTCIREDGAGPNFIDSSNGNRAYKTVYINCQRWLAENLSRTAGCDGHYDYPDGDKNNAAAFGLLYDWSTANCMCPKGWHLPSIAEFEALLNYVDEHRTSKSAFLALAANSDAWTAQKGNDDFGFAALPAGERLGNSFANFGKGAFFWASDKKTTYNAYRLRVSSGATNADGTDTTGSFLSVRCIQD